MPKQVDHDQRRRRIADAVCRLAGRTGLDGVSLRTVAREAGVSMGQVQHYFTTKDEMLLFAFRVMSEAVERRLQGTWTGAENPPSTRCLLRVLLVALLPVDGDARFEAPLWIAFLARAVHATDLADLLRQDGRRMTEFVVGLLRAAEAHGELAPGVDPQAAALTLLALADGLTLRVVLDPGSAGTAVQAIDDELARLFRPSR